MAGVLNLVNQTAIVTGAGSGIGRCDVNREDDVLWLFEQAVGAFGSVDILVANAGIQQDATLTEMTLQQCDRVIAVNLTGEFLCSREAVRYFLKQGVRSDVSCAAGKIICISSVHQVIPWAGHVNYAASKGGVDMMMQSIAQEAAEHKYDSGQQHRAGCDSNADQQVRLADAGGIGQAA